MKTKFLNLIIVVFITFIFFGFVSESHAQKAIATVAPTAAANCNNPFDTQYNSEACVKSRLGIQDLTNVNQVLIARDPNTIFVVAAQVVLWIAVAVSVLRIAWKGIQIGGAGDDADKRKELFVAIIWALVGLMVALGALGITNFVATLVFGDNLSDRIVDCTQLPANASTDLKNKCNDVINGANGNGKGIITVPTP